MQKRVLAGSLVILLEHRVQESCEEPPGGLLPPTLSLTWEAVMKQFLIPSQVLKVRAVLVHPTPQNVAAGCETAWLPPTIGSWTSDYLNNLHCALLPLFILVSSILVCGTGPGCWHLLATLPFAVYVSNKQPKFQGPSLSFLAESVRSWTWPLSRFYLSCILTHLIPKIILWSVFYKDRYTECYRLNACVLPTPNSYVEAITHNVAALGSGSCVIWFRWGPEGTASMMVSVLVKTRRETKLSLSLCKRKEDVMWAHSKMVSVCRPGRESFTRN